MLREIRCNKFMDEGIERPPLEFGKGLNAVLGSSTGSNSIGKSTLLLIIDFAFGGDAYSKQRDILENVGPHAIEFCFSFNGNDYRFSRSPMDPSTIWKCDKGYAKIESLKTDEFRQWLARQFGLDGLGGTFRGLCSTFFRVYGKDNHDPSRPLAANKMETKKTGVTRLLRLLGKYAAIDEAQRSLDEATKAKKAYNDSLSHEFIASAKTKAEVKANETKIAALTFQIEELEELEHDNASALDPLVAEQLAEARCELSTLRRKRTRLLSRIASIDTDEDLGKFRTSKDFGKLLEFFPGTNIRKLEEIESFHHALNSILEDERKEQKKSLSKYVDALDENIRMLGQEIGEIGVQSNLTTAVLRRYSELALEKKRLEDANASFQKKAKLAQAKKSAKEHRNALTEAALSEAQAEVNDELVRLNELVCGSGVSVPRLSLPKPEDYSFGIANDSGTGSQARAMALLDLALLELSPLPAIALDTVSSKHISDERMLKLLELYKKENKQVFVAFDKAESYESGEALRVLDGCVVIHLSEGHELFGRSWAKNSGED